VYNIGGEHHTPDLAPVTTAPRYLYNTSIYTGREWEGLCDWGHTHSACSTSVCPYPCAQSSRRLIRDSSIQHRLAGIQTCVSVVMMGGSSLTWIPAVSLRALSLLWHTPSHAHTVVGIVIISIYKVAHMGAGRSSRSGNNSYVSWRGIHPILSPSQLSLTAPRRQTHIHIPHNNVYRHWHRHRYWLWLWVRSHSICCSS
jgi:hypothetical protein